MEIVVGSTVGDNSRRRTLMSDDKVDTPNLRDFLRIKEDISSNLRGLTLGAVLSYKREGTTTSPVHSNRTLLDIIRDDPYATKQTRKTWKHFKQKLRIKRRRNNPIDDLTRPELSASGSGSGLDGAPIQRNSSQFENLMSTPSAIETHNDVEIIEAADESVDENEEGNNAEEEREPEQPVRMSLMSLLAETDGSSFMIGDRDENEEDGRVTGGEVVVGEYNNCCVCMVRHKGSAFIPCGHTFCRLCSRELWVQRGSCPLCNNFIVEILDIF